MAQDFTTFKSITHAMPGWEAWQDMGQHLNENMHPLELNKCTRYLNQHAVFNDFLSQNKEEHAALVRSMALLQQAQKSPFVHTPLTQRYPTIYREGSTCLLDAAESLPCDAPAVILVPSLINRANIFTLLPEHHVVAWLKEQGIRSLILDWQEPLPTEYGLSMEEYVDRLGHAMEAACGYTGTPPAIAGYCMGGLLALAAALRHPQKAGALILLATPWDFHSEDVVPTPPSKDVQLPLMKGLEALLNIFPVVPPFLVSGLLYAFRPWSEKERLQVLSTALEGVTHQEYIVAREQWLRSGVAMTSSVAKTCFMKWALQNKVACGNDGLFPDKVPFDALQHTPIYVAYATKDTVIPPCSAKAIAPLLPHAVYQEIEAGHVSLVAGENAKEKLWMALAEWIKLH